MCEEWRTVPGWCYYEVSNLGAIRRKPGHYHRYKCIEGITLKQYYNGHKYLFVALREDGIRQSIEVHKIVASAFIGPRPIRYDTHHIDGDKNNNKASNLEYISHGLNILKGKEAIKKQAEGLIDKSN
jgi:hypothetical protein